MVLPARDEFNYAYEGERQARGRLKRQRCSHEDYRNATRHAAKTHGDYRAAIWMANQHVGPLAKLIWGERDDEQPLVTYGILCGPDGFTNFTDEPMAFQRAAGRVKLSEQDFAAIIECCELFATAGAA